MARRIQAITENRRVPPAAHRERSATAVHMIHRLRQGTPADLHHLPEEPVGECVAAECAGVRLVDDEVVVDDRGERVGAVGSSRTSACSEAPTPCRWGSRRSG